jgi:toxin ParE1/3/4
MLELKLSPQAIKDLEEIYDFTILHWGLSQAEKYQDELYSTMQTIIENPSSGSIYYFREGNYKKININRHIIFYNLRDTDTSCLIVRILHESIDLKINLE